MRQKTEVQAAHRFSATRGRLIALERAQFDNTVPSWLSLVTSHCTHSLGRCRPFGEGDEKHQSLCHGHRFGEFCRRGLAPLFGRKAPPRIAARRICVHRGLRRCAHARRRGVGGCAGRSSDRLSSSWCSLRGSSSGASSTFLSPARITCSTGATAIGRSCSKSVLRFLFCSRLQVCQSLAACLRRDPEVRCAIGISLCLVGCLAIRPQFTAAAPAAAESKSRGPVSPEKRIDALFQDWNTPNSPGASVAVVRHGKLDCGDRLNRLTASAPRNPACRARHRSFSTAHRSSSCGKRSSAVRNWSNN